MHDILPWPYFDSVHVLKVTIDGLGWIQRSVTARICVPEAVLVGS